MTNHPALLIAVAGASLAAIPAPGFSAPKVFPSSAPTCSAHPAPVEDIAAQVAKFRPVQMPFSTNGLSAREVQMVRKLVEAGQYF